MDKKEIDYQLEILRKDDWYSSRVGREIRRKRREVVAIKIAIVIVVILLGLITVQTVSGV